MRIVSRMDGEFEGWTGETVVRLVNGRAWQQAVHHHAYRYAYMPEVAITLRDGQTVMRVAGGAGRSRSR